MVELRALSLVAALGVAFFACKASPKPEAPAPRTPAEPTGEHFGAAFSAAPEVNLAGLLGGEGAPPDHPVKLDGMVRRSCTRQGCWLELATAMAEDAPSCRVLMKGHAFFVPLDSAGSRARVEGQVESEIVPAALVSHMEQEGGHFQHKNPDGSATELRVIASGVELSRATKR